MDRLLDVSASVGGLPPTLNTSYQHRLAGLTQHYTSRFPGNIAGSTTSTAGASWGDGSTGAGGGVLPSGSSFLRRQQEVVESKGAAAIVDDRKDHGVEWGVTAEVQEQRELLGLKSGIHPMQLWGEEDGKEEVPGAACKGGHMQGGWGSGSAAAMVQGLVGSSAGGSCWAGQGQQVEASGLAWFQQELSEVSVKGHH